ncbi:MAG: hypothetical protein RSB76_02855 [Clostridia bacterium]
MFKKIKNANDIIGDAMYIFLTIFALFILILFYPLKIKIKWSTSNKYVCVYIFEIIRVSKIKLGDNTKREIKNKFDVSIKSINKIKRKLNDIKFIIIKIILTKTFKINNAFSIKMFNLDFGFNTNDVILNAYILAFLNSIINIYFVCNQKRIKNVLYKTYISNKNINLKFDGIFNLKLVNTICIIFQIMLEIRKVEHKNGRTTSNRKFNVNSYDIT